MLKKTIGLLAMNFEYTMPAEGGLKGIVALHHEFFGAADDLISQ